MSKIIVENIWAEDLFEWFYNYVQSSGGDGAGCIACGNYKETANWFVEWFIKKFNVQENGDLTIYNTTLKKDNIVHLGDKKFWHPRHEYENIVNFHDSNENFMFSNKDLDLGHGDYTFVVMGDCQFGFEPPNSNKIIKKI